jgi:uncharacterized protein (TIGR03067 family)
MRRLHLALVIGLILAAGIARAVDKTDETRNWQGTWNMVSCTWNGEPQNGNVQWIVKGDQYTIWMDHKSGQDPHTFKLDPSKKQIDVFHHETPKGTWGGSLKGIYEIKGDTLKVCYDLKGERYPKGFEAGPGSGQVVYQFKRENR